MRRTILLIPVLLGTLAVTVSAQTAPEADLTGLYICNGVSPDGSSYEGSVACDRSRRWAMVLTSLDRE